MTFPRIKSLGWAFGEQLTSAQMTALDIDHANAVDGAAGGTYAAPLTFSNLVGGNVASGTFGFADGATLELAVGARLRIDKKNLIDQDVSLELGDGVNFYVVSPMSVSRFATLEASWIVNSIITFQMKTPTAAPLVIRDSSHVAIAQMSNASGHYTGLVLGKYDTTTPEWGIIAGVKN